MGPDLSGKAITVTLQMQAMLDEMRRLGQQVVRRDQLSYPIVNQRRAAHIAQERINASTI